jgi:glycosyltransferase involved in cell wall biosynthesis
VFCLSGGIKDVYADVLKIPEERLFVTPNGVNVDKFRVENIPEKLSDSIYLAKIDYRKRQHLFQSIKNLYYAGNNADPRFDTSNNYLGEWSKETLYNDLTKYGNLVLLSDGEAHPLVCLEAFAAGLGVIVSQWAAANLDTSKDFISVIPEDKISDIEFVENEILQNKFYSINHRQEILDYAKTFDWTEVVKNYYIPAMETIIGNYK